MRPSSFPTHATFVAIAVGLAACGGPGGPTHRTPVELASAEDADGRLAARIVEATAGASLVVEGRGGSVDVRFLQINPRRGERSLIGQVTIDLPADADEEVELPLPDTGGDPIRVELVAAGGDRPELASAVIERPGEPPPPIVLVSIDTLAARHLSAYGYVRETTPNLDRFADEAIVFERCTSNAPWTVPSYMSLFSGLHHNAFRILEDPSVTTPSIWEEWFMGPRRHLLAELLGGAGYATGGWVDMLWLDEKGDFTQGFDAFDTSAARIPAKTWSGGLVHIRPRVTAWLDSLDAGRTPFVFVHAYDVHAPYLPPEETRGTFQGDALARGPDEMLPVSELNFTYGAVMPYAARLTEAGDDEAPAEISRNRLVAAYDEEILALDAELERLFDDLRARDLFERSVIVVTADHGEGTGQHDWYFSHGHLFDEDLHVPLMIRLPGGRGGGARVETPVQLVDLYPTLAELARVDTTGRNLHGRSLVPLLEGDELEELPRLAEDGIFPGAAVEFGSWKLIETRPSLGQLVAVLTHPRARRWLADHVPELGGRVPSGPEAQAMFAAASDPALIAELQAFMHGPFVELYDLANDPAEREDLAASEAARRDELLDLLRTMQRVRSASRGFDGDGPPPIEMDAEMAAELAATGYGGG